MLYPRIRILAAILLLAIAGSLLAHAAAPSGLVELFSGVGGERVATKHPSDTGPIIQAPAETKPKQREQFTLYRNVEGELVCRKATAEEIRERESIDPNALGLRRINHLELKGPGAAQQPDAATGLMIILRATQQLQQNATATAAFTRAAQNWESLIMSPITIYIDVDYGTTNFGQTWPSGVLGATSAPTASYPYPSVRSNLVAEASGEGNATKQAVFNALPSNTVPTDLGDAVSTAVSVSTARAIGLLPATAQSADPAPRIGFNSNFDSSFDFDPSDGITTGKIDFDAVATHEIGHALGFHSEAGLSAARPSIWDLYRFRTGTTSGTFTTAQRILTIGGSPDPLQFFFVPGNSELGLSTGGPTGSGGDGAQSSHWKHANCGFEIGVMDPAIPNGCRRVITANDQLALASFGYNLTNNNAPPPPPPTPTPPPNDNFANAQTITSCSGSTTGSNFGATSEPGEPSHDPPDSTSLSPTSTVWYQWQAPSSGNVTITTAGSDFDTILAVYTGNSIGALTRLVFNDDVQNGVIRTSTVTFSATAGTTYMIVVDGWGGDAGGIKLNWTGCGATPTPTPSPTPVNCPTILTVNDNGDASDASPGDGACASSTAKCTFRAAIQEANSRSACGTIDLNFSTLTGAISLGTVLPDINHNINVNGSGPGQLTVQRSTASGTADFRVMHILTGRTVNLSGLTISNGKVGFAQFGGGILNEGNLTLSAVTISNNAAQDGGGLFNGSGSLTIFNSTITNNSTNSGSGAGIESSGSNTTVFYLINSTISNNVSSSSGGALAIGAPSNARPAFIINSTISNNMAQNDAGGVLLSNAPGFVLNIVNSTITGNRANLGSGGKGGGISRFAGTALLRNTIVAGNFRGAGTIADDIADPVDASSSFNLIGTGGAGGLSNGSNNNQVGVSNLGLGALANNGGPTMTHALFAGSPAINAGSNALAVDQNGSALSFDQQGVGFARIMNGTVDIGAYEVQTPAFANPIDEANIFVTRQYLDFLNRQPDQSGLAFWTGNITSCGSDPQCIEVKRINVSGAFFLSIEFQQTGFYVLRMQRVAFGRRSKDPATRMTLANWLADVAQVGSGVVVLQPGWEQVLENNKQAYATQIVNSAAFTSRYPTTLTASQYVDALVATAAIPVTTSERNAAITAFGAGGTSGRIAALRSIADVGQLTAQGSETLPGGLSPTLATNEGVNREFREAFVLMQYFGYLRRDPDDGGYQFWLYKLNQFAGNYQNAEMVKAFLASDEYRHRFGP